MKKYLFIILLVSIGFSQKSYNEKHLVEQNGIWFKKFSDEVVNGEVFKKIGGMEAPLGKMKNGKKDGKWIIWRQDGTKEEEQYFKDGKVDGTWKEFGLDGKLFAEKEMYGGVDNYMYTRYDDLGKKVTIGQMILGKPYKGKFIENRQEKLGFVTLRRNVHTSYDDSKLKEIIYFDERNDTLKIERIVDGEMKIVLSNAQKIELQKEMEARKKRKDYLDSIEKFLAFEEGLFKVYYRQFMEGENNTLYFELENSYNVNYHSVWFMVTAIKEGSNEEYSKRIAFYPLI